LLLGFRHDDERADLPHAGGLVGTRLARASQPGQVRAGAGGSTRGRLRGAR